jgi:glucosamine 6-phosphate synthetase-like amidotransferase/phosphosugar isomerase protein
MLKKTKTLIAAFVVTLFLAGAVPTQAMDRDHDRERKCEQRIRNAENKLQQAIRKHGERSRQAENRRRELEEARERCRRGHR